MLDKKDCFERVAKTICQLREDGVKCELGTTVVGRAPVSAEHLVVKMSIFGDALELFANSLAAFEIEIFEIHEDR